MKQTVNLRKNTKKISKKKTKQRKKLGQIFLKDENTLKKIVSLIAEKETDFILEIGAGSGALTEKLLKLDKPVLAVEIDLNWATVLKKKFENHKNFTLIVGDILKLNFKEILPIHKKTCLVGNLPYQISTPLFFLLIQNRQLFDYFIFMFQKEFAMRIIGDKKKSAKNFGSLAVLGELFFCLEKILEVPKKFFHPVPKVDSIVLKMKKNSFEMKKQKEFFVFLQCFFQQPRKTLFNNLKQAYPNILEIITNNSKNHFLKLRPAELESKQILELFYSLEKTN